MLDEGSFLFLSELNLVHINLYRRLDKLLSLYEQILQSCLGSHVPFLLTDDHHG